MPIIAGISAALLVFGTWDMAAAQFQEVYGLTRPTALLFVFLLIVGMPATVYIFRSRALREHFDFTRVFLIFGAAPAFALTFVFYWVCGGSSGDHLFFAALHAIPCTFLLLRIHDWDGGFQRRAVRLGYVSADVTAPAIPVTYQGPSAPSGPPRCPTCEKLFPNLPRYQPPLALPAPKAATADDTPDWLKFDPARFAKE